MGKSWVVRFSGRSRPVRRGGRTLPFRKGYFWVSVGRAKILLDFSPRLGMCVRWVGRNWWGDWPPLGVGTHYERPSMKKKTGKVPEGQGKHLAPVESETFKDLMPLVEHCCCRAYDDGDPREPGWITVKTAGSAWIVQVKDPDSCMFFSAVGATLDKALETAALLLACEEAPWEPDTWLAASKAKKSKK